MNKFWGHLRTIQKHRKEVRRLCFKCGLYWRGLVHDLSKYSPTEFWRGVKFYTGNESPTIAERKALGYSEAWMHHQGRNKHHSEYWYDNIDGKRTPIDMTFVYLIEMVCDRIAAAKTYLKDKYTDNSPWAYYAEHFEEDAMSDSTRALLEYYLRYLKFNGEKSLITEIRSGLKYWYDTND